MGQAKAASRTVYRNRHGLTGVATRNATMLVELAKRIAPSRTQSVRKRCFPGAGRVIPLCNGRDLLHTLSTPNHSKTGQLVSPPWIPTNGWEQPCRERKSGAHSKVLFTQTAVRGATSRAYAVHD